MPDLERVSCGDNSAQLADPFPRLTPPSRIILLSRYRDDIHVCLLHFPDSEVPFIKELISHLTRCYTRCYGIKLKWEPSPDHVVWGEAALSTQT